MRYFQCRPLAVRCCTYLGPDYRGCLSSSSRGGSLSSGCDRLTQIDAHVDISTPRNGKVHFKGIYVAKALRGRGIILYQAETRRLTVTFDPAIKPIFEIIRKKRLTRQETPRTARIVTPLDPRIETLS